MWRARAPLGQMCAVCVFIGLMCEWRSVRRFVVSIRSCISRVTNKGLKNEHYRCDPVAIWGVGHGWARNAPTYTHISVLARLPAVLCARQPQSERSALGLAPPSVGRRTLSPTGRDLEDYYTNQTNQPTDTGWYVLRTLVPAYVTLDSLSLFSLSLSSGAQTGAAALSPRNSHQAHFLHLHFCRIHLALLLFKHV
jgi:hypothetical protein